MYKRHVSLLLLCFVGSFVAAQASPHADSNAWVFIRAFLKEPRKIGAPASCSDRVAQEIKEYIRKNTNGLPCNMLEAGPGNGVITKDLVTLLKPTDTLILVEYSKSLCSLLKKQYKAHGSVHVHYGSIAEFNPAGKKFKHIVSTIPFYNLSITDLKKTLAMYEESLEEGGTLSFVEFSNFGRGICKAKEWAQLAVNAARSMLLRNKQQLTPYENTAIILDQFMHKFVVDKTVVPQGCGMFTIYVYNLKKSISSNS